MSTYGEQLHVLDIFFAYDLNLLSIVVTILHLVISINNCSTFPSKPFLKRCLIYDLWFLKDLRRKTMDVFWGTSVWWEILLLLEEIMQIYLDME